MFLIRIRNKSNATHGGQRGRRGPLAGPSQHPAPYRL